LAALVGEIVDIELRGDFAEGEAGSKINGRVLRKAILKIARALIEACHSFADVA
jgi:hypothetical protein